MVVLACAVLVWCAINQSNVTLLPLPAPASILILGLKSPPRPLPRPRPPSRPPRPRPPATYGLRGAFKWFNALATVVCCSYTHPNQLTGCRAALLPTQLSFATFNFCQQPRDQGSRPGQEQNRAWMWSAGQVRKGNGADGAPHENGISIPSPRNSQKGAQPGLSVCGVSAGLCTN